MNDLAIDHFYTNPPTLPHFCVSFKWIVRFFIISPCFVCVYGYFTFTYTHEYNVLYKFMCKLQSVIQMSGFRSLGDEEEVEFACKESEKGLEATIVTGRDGNECIGSSRRPMSKKKVKKIRWAVLKWLSNQ